VKAGTGFWAGVGQVENMTDRLLYQFRPDGNGKQGRWLAGVVFVVWAGGTGIFFFGWVGGVGLKAVESLLVATGVTALIRLGG